MAEQMSLNDVLSEKEPGPREPAAPEKPAEAPAAEKPPVETAKSSRKAHEDREQAAQGRVRDPETGQFVKVEEKPAEAPKEPAKPEAKAEPAKEPAKPAAPPQQEFTEREKAFLRDAEENRRKRQELERRLAAIEAAQPKPPATTEPAKTFYDDPEGALAKQSAENRKEIISARLQFAEMIARKAHPDFDEKIAVFNQIVEKTPGLVGQMIAAADPAEFAYSLGKNHMELQQAGSIDGLRAQIEKETRIKLEAEMREKAEKLALERAALPPSLSEARATGVNKPVWGGPTSLEDVIGGKG